MTLNELFKNTTYDDTLFSVEDKSTIESRIFMKSVRGSEVPYITCAIRDKEIKLTPEEAVRQLYIYKLMNDYGYAASRIQLETPIHFGREVKRADIAIMDKDRPMVPYIIVELKKPKLTDGKEQLKSYCNAKIDFAEHHYETECTVRWNESLSETAIKNASITSVVDSQEKELAAAI